MWVEWEVLKSKGKFKFTFTPGGMVSDVGKGGLYRASSDEVVE